MAAKEVKFAGDARDRMLRGVDMLANAVQGHARPQGPQRGAREELRRTAHHQGRRHRRQGDRARGQVREHGRPDGARGRPARPTTHAGDGTTTATVLAQAIVREGAKSVAAGMNPMDLKRGIDIAVAGRRRRHQEARQEGRLLGRGRPGRHHLVERRQQDRQDDRRGDAEGRQRGRDHGRRSQVARHRGRDRRGHAVRPRLSLAVLHHQRREDGGRARGRLHPPAREEAVAACRPCCRCWRRWCSRASRSSSSPRTSRARRSPRSWSTSCAAASRSRPSRRRASAIAARPCSRTSRSSPAVS